MKNHTHHTIKLENLYTENDHIIQMVKHMNEAYYEQTGKRRTHHTITYGCQMNEHDSEKINALMRAMGYERVEEPDNADFVLFNTCAVRENAELRVFGNLGHMKHLKSKRPGMILAVSGCMMQQAQVVALIKKKYSHVDLIFGTHNLHYLPRYLHEILEKKTRHYEVWDIDGEIIEGLPYERKFGLKAYVNIMFGCNNFCSYCIVPYTRGRERSRQKEHILEEVSLLARDGVKEITLLGQNVNSYGKTFDREYRFKDLLHEVSKVEGIERVRFMTSNPKDLSEGLMDEIQRNHKVVESVHLPIQAGSDALLKRMNRGYTVEKYLGIVAQLRQRIPGIGLSTDIIVGFPGETEQDIDDLIDIIRSVRFDSAFTYIYSPRTGTPAADYPDQIPEKLKHQRFERMLKVLNEEVVRLNKSREGRVYEVLIEGYKDEDRGILTGRTRENYIMTLAGDKALIGKTVKVAVTRARKFSLEGQII